MDAAIAMVEEFDPDLVFVNLGDVDRVGHADLSGTTLKAARTAALASDERAGRPVRRRMLKSSGRWASAMVLVLADHSMDWSVPQQTISLTSVFDGDPLAGGQFPRSRRTEAPTSSTGPARPSSRRCGLAKMRSLVPGHVTGVFQAHVHRPDPRPAARCPTPVTCSSTARPAGGSATPARQSNPIPGNHGHPATEPIPFFVGGGSSLVRKGIARSAKAHTMDVAPTLGEVLRHRSAGHGLGGLLAPARLWKPGRACAPDRV